MDRKHVVSSEVSRSVFGDVHISQDVDSFRIVSGNRGRVVDHMVACAEANDKQTVYAI